MTGEAEAWTAVTEADKQLNLRDEAWRGQWDLDRDVAWDVEHDPENPLGLPASPLLIAFVEDWDRMAAPEQRALSRKVQAWELSQILHGERASIICASLIADRDGRETIRELAAIQVVDERRHEAGFGRLLSTRLGAGYAPSRALGGLLQDVIGDPRLDISILGMQVLLEGMSLSTFRNFTVYSRDATVQTVMRLVVRDEARHFAAGRFGLAPLLAQMSSRELREREQFVIEAFATLHDHVLGVEILEEIDPKIRRSMRGNRSPVAANLRRSLFRRLVPAVRDVGLLTPDVRKLLETFDVSDYAEYGL